MTRVELENSRDDIFCMDNGLTRYYGTGAYWRQIAVNNWHKNINDIQERISNPTDFACDFFDNAISKINIENIAPETYIFTSMDI